MIRFPSFPFMTSKTLAELKPTPVEPRPTFKIAQDLTQTAIDKLATRKKELEASIALASAELAHTASTLEALGQARQSFREGNTKHTAAQLKDVKIGDLIVDGAITPYTIGGREWIPEDADWKDYEYLSDNLNIPPHWYPFHSGEAFATMLANPNRPEIRKKAVPREATGLTVKELAEKGVKLYEPAMDARPRHPQHPETGGSGAPAKPPKR